MAALPWLDYLLSGGVSDGCDSKEYFNNGRTNRLDYSKGNEKQVMLYWFMFKKFGSKDAVSMVRISTPVINNETATFGVMKSFVEDELFKAMYTQADPKTITVAEDVMNTYGNSGMIAIAMGLLIPFGLIFAGVRRKN